MVNQHPSTTTSPPISLEFSSHYGGYSGFIGQQAKNILPYSPNMHYVYCAIICKCERLGIHCDFHPILSPNSDSCDSILSQISALLCVVRLAVFVQCTGGNEKPLPTGNRTVGWISDMSEILVAPREGISSKALHRMRSSRTVWVDTLLKSHGNHTEITQRMPGLTGFHTNQTPKQTD